MGKTLNGGYKITANIWTKTINGDTANSTGLSKRQIWNKNEELNQQVWRSTLKKNMDSSQTQRDCNGTRMETQEKNMSSSTMILQTRKPHVLGDCHQGVTSSHAPT
jgi:hypothetical protein